MAGWVGRAGTAWRQGPQADLELDREGEVNVDSLVRADHHEHPTRPPPIFHLVLSVGSSFQSLRGMSIRLDAPRLLPLILAREIHV